MTMVAETVDAVIGGNTHRDTHALEMTAPNGATIATLTIPQQRIRLLRCPRVDRRARPRPPRRGRARGHPQLRNRAGSRVDRCRAHHRRGRASPSADTAPWQVRPDRRETRGAAGAAHARGTKGAATQ